MVKKAKQAEKVQSSGQIANGAADQRDECIWRLQEIKLDIQNAACFEGQRGSSNRQILRASAQAAQTVQCPQSQATGDAPAMAFACYININTNRRAEWIWRAGLERPLPLHLPLFLFGQDYS